LIQQPKQAALSGLPGAGLITDGIAALKRGERTQEALLVAIASTRLKEIGLDVPDAASRIKNPNLALYAAVCRGGGGHSQYNALLRRLTSFIRTATQVLPSRNLISRG